MAAGPLTVAVFLKLHFEFSSGGSCVCFTVGDSQWCPEGNQTEAACQEWALNTLNTALYQPSYSAAFLTQNCASLKNKAKNRAVF